MNSADHPYGVPYRQLFDTSHDAMLVLPLSQDGTPQRFLEVNASVCQLLGYTREQMLSFTPVDIGKDFDIERWFSIAQTLREEGEASFNASFNSSSGAVVHTEVSVRRVQLDDTYLAMAIARDITSQVEAEQALRETERDLNALINAHPETVILVASDSTIIHCNITGAARFDTTPEKVRGRRILDLVTAELEPSRRQINERMRATGDTTRFQDFRNGMHLDHTVTPIGNTPHARRYAIFSRDVTEEFIRTEVENLLGDIDRSILRGGDIDTAANMVCTRLARAFDSPWVCFEGVAGAPLKFIHYGGGVGDSIGLPGRVSQDELALLIGSEPAYLPTESLPRRLSKALEAMNCHEVATVPVVFRQDQTAALLIALPPSRNARSPEILGLLGHIASRLRVAWGKTRELGKLSLLRQALESARTAVMLATMSGEIVWCNRALAEAVGADPKDLLGRRTREFLVDSHASSLRLMDQEIRAGRTWAGESEVRRLDGSCFIALQSVTPVYEGVEEVPSHVIVIQEDITSHKQSQARIRYLAEHDPLTGLHNRVALMNRLGELLKDGRRGAAEVALLYLDIDHFKPINDTHGHDIGDKLLVGFAERLNESVREDDMVCRLGGDEFVIVLRRIDEPGSAARVAQNLLERIGEPFIFGELELHVGTSIGISMASAFYRKQLNPEATDLLRAGDDAMYLAKQNGRNRFVFSVLTPTGGDK